MESHKNAFQTTVNSNSRRTTLFCTLLLFFSLMGATHASWPYQNETPRQRNARLAWWRDARFGMFIHWGVYAVPGGVHKGKKVIGKGGEWIMNRGQIPVAEYKQYAARFNPVNYNPDEWVRLAKTAGMKYIVITAKHHDGFALFDSKVTDWDVVDATPYGKDLLKPLAEACQRHGIKLGFYYSQALDWCQGYGNNWDPAGYWLRTKDMDAYLKNSNCKRWPLEGGETLEKPTVGGDSSRRFGSGRQSPKSPSNRRLESPPTVVRLQFEELTSIQNIPRWPRNAMPCWRHTGKRSAPTRGRVGSGVDA